MPNAHSRPQRRTLYPYDVVTSIDASKRLPHHSRYQHLTGYLGMFCSDTFKSNVKSLQGNMYCQLFCNRGNYRKTYPLKSKSEAHHALDSFIHDVGIPKEMLTDNDKELHLSEWGEYAVSVKSANSQLSLIGRGRIMLSSLVVRPNAKSEI